MDRDASVTFCDSVGNGSDDDDDDDDKLYAAAAGCDRQTDRQSAIAL